MIKKNEELKKKDKNARATEEDEIAISFYMSRVWKNPELTSVCWLGMQKIPSNRPESSWRFTYARWAILSELYPKKSHPPELLYGVFTDLPAVENSTELSDLRLDVSKAIDSSDLSSFDREIIYLRFYEGLSSREIAQRLGTSPQNIHLHFKKIFTTLKEGRLQSYAPAK